MSFPFFFFSLLLLASLFTLTTSTLTLHNTTLPNATFPSTMMSAQFDHFPERSFFGLLVPLTFLPECRLRPVGGSLEGTPLVGIVSLKIAKEAGCVRIYDIAMALQTDEGFVGLVMNSGNPNTNNWFPNRAPFKDVSDLEVPVAEIAPAVWEEIEPFVKENGEGDVWISVGTELSPLVVAHNEPATLGTHYTLLALWAVVLLLICGQLFFQNRAEWNFNTSCKVLLLSVYTCLCNIVYLAADPWGLSVDASLLVLPLFLSSLGTIYLSYAITVFKWVKIFNVFGHKSAFFKTRRPLIGILIAFTLLLAAGTFFAIYFGFSSMSLVLTGVFILITPFQITVFAIYGFKVTKSLAKSVQTTGSVEMRLAQIRMFSLTMVAIVIWVFAFIVSVVSAVLGDGRTPDQKRLTEVLINVFFLLGVLSICATYAFAFISRSVLGGSSHHRDSSTGGTGPHQASITHSLSRNGESRRMSSSIHQDDCEASQVAVAISPMSTIKEYQIGDLAVEL